MPCIPGLFMCHETFFLWFSALCSMQKILSSFTCENTMSFESATEFQPPPPHHNFYTLVVLTQRQVAFPAQCTARGNNANAVRKKQSIKNQKQALLFMLFLLHVLTDNKIQRVNLCLIVSVQGKYLFAYNLQIFQQPFLVLSQKNKFCKNVNLSEKSERSCKLVNGLIWGKNHLEQPQFNWLFNKNLTNFQSTIEKKRIWKMFKNHPALSILKFDISSFL